MKTCPKCKQTYTDANLNFCLNDGEMLVLEDNAPPTIFMDAPRTTNPNWQTNQPIDSWQNQPIMQQNQPFSPQSQYNPPTMQPIGMNQTLPIVSLVLGIMSLGLFCCWFGAIPLSIGALITGYMGMNNANTNPQAYSGKGLAIGGMVTGGIGLVISFLMLIIGLISNIAK
jgi:hypothetical protein